jgi:DnaK suppressor protein
MTSTTTDFLAAQQRELEARRDSYLADVARSTATALELTEDGANQDMADEDGFGEGDTLNVERDRLLLVASEARAKVAEIDAALERVEAGTYGVCEACGKPIPKARLEVVPEATLCVGCKTGASLRRK